MDRAVVFLDPYGMAVDWTTVEALAATKKVDLWVLYPIGVAVNRLLTNRRIPTGPWADALTRFFGSGDWRQEFYRPSPQLSLFDNSDEEVQKDASFESLGRYFIRRLETVFEGVSPNYLTLRNSRNTPLFLLCFAVGNPKGKEPALRIANHILRN
jgi:three-Cys-motif partner protein